METSYYPAGEYDYYPTVEYYQEIAIEFTNPKEIAEIQKCLIYRSYNEEFGPFPEIFPHFEVEAAFEVGDGVLYEDGLIAWSDRFHFEADDVPRFVIDRMLEELEAEGK